MALIIMINCFVCHLSVKDIFYQASQPEDTQSKILGATDPLLIEENTDSISSVLREEIDMTVDQVES